MPDTRAPAVRGDVPFSQQRIVAQKMKTAMPELKDAEDGAVWQALREQFPAELNDDALAGALMEQMQGTAWGGAVKEFPEVSVGITRTPEGKEVQVSQVGPEARPVVKDDSGWLNWSVRMLKAAAYPIKNQIEGITKLPQNLVKWGEHEYQIREAETRGNAPAWVPQSQRVSPAEAALRKAEATGAAMESGLKVGEGAILPVSMAAGAGVASMTRAAQGAGAGMLKNQIIRSALATGTDFATYEFYTGLAEGATIGGALERAKWGGATGAVMGGAGRAAAGTIGKRIAGWFKARTAAQAAEHSTYNSGVFHAMSADHLVENFPDIAAGLHGGTLTPEQAVTKLMEATGAYLDDAGMKGVSQYLLHRVPELGDAMVRKGALDAAAGAEASKAFGQQELFKAAEMSGGGGRPISPYMEQGEMFGPAEMNPAMARMQQELPFPETPARTPATFEPSTGQVELPFGPGFARGEAIPPPTPAAPPAQLGTGQMGMQMGPGMAPEVGIEQAIGRTVRGETPIIPPASVREVVPEGGQFQLPLEDVGPARGMSAAERERGYGLGKLMERGAREWTPEEIAREFAAEPSAPTGRQGGLFAGMAEGRGGLPLEGREVQDVFGRNLKILKKMSPMRYMVETVDGEVKTMHRFDIYEGPPGKLASELAAKEAKAIENWKRATKGRVTAGVDPTAVKAAIEVAAYRLVRWGTHTEALKAIKQSLKDEFGAAIRGQITRIMREAGLYSRKNFAKDIKSSMEPTIKRVDKLVQEGLPFKDWFTELDKGVQEVFRKGSADYNKFQGYLAGLSPRMGVRQNVNAAITAFVEDKLGLPFSESMPARVKNLMRTKEGAPVQGPKARPFELANKGDLKQVVVDTWMLNIYGWNKPSLARIRFIQRDVLEAARRHGIEPAEVQAAMWSAIKKEQEGPNAGGIDIGAEIRKQFGLARNPDELVKMHEPRVRRVAQENAYIEDGLKKLRQEEPTGHTWNFEDFTEDTSPGKIVSVASVNMPIEKISQSTIRSAKRFAGIMKDQVDEGEIKIGIWPIGEKDAMGRPLASVDINLSVPDKETAIEIGMRQNPQQRVYWDKDLGQEGAINPQAEQRMIYTDKHSEADKILAASSRKSRNILKSLNESRMQGPELFKIEELRKIAPREPRGGMAAGAGKWASHEQAQIMQSLKNSSSLKKNVVPFVKWEGRAGFFLPDGMVYDGRNSIHDAAASPILQYTGLNTFDQKKMLGPADMLQTHGIIRAWQWTPNFGVEINKKPTPQQMITVAALIRQAKKEGGIFEWTIWDVGESGARHEKYGSIEDGRPGEFMRAIEEAFGQTETTRKAVGAVRQEKLIRAIESFSKPLEPSQVNMKDSGFIGPTGKFYQSNYSPHPKTAQRTVTIAGMPKEGDALGQLQEHGFIRVVMDPKSAQWGGGIGFDVVGIPSPEARAAMRGLVAKARRELGPETIIEWRAGEGGDGAFQGFDSLDKFFRFIEGKEAGQ